MLVVLGREIKARLNLLGLQLLIRMAAKVPLSRRSLLTSKLNAETSFMGRQNLYPSPNNWHNSMELNPLISWYNSKMSYVALTYRPSEILVWKISGVKHSNEYIEA